MPTGATTQSFPIIAIDGPAASGKGTLARNLAQLLGYAHLDSGALYRLVGKVVLDSQTSPDDLSNILRITKEVYESFSLDSLKNKDLRNDQVGAITSQIATIGGVREILLDLQRNFAHNPPPPCQGSILDGRDIGTVVCPDAALKLYVIADPETRAKRRYKELQLTDIAVTYEAVLDDMRARDARDQGRKEAPLKAAEDAVLLDTSELSAEEALNRAMDHVNRIVSKQI